jgi:hypothetical protein
MIRASTLSSPSQTRELITRSETKLHAAHSNSRLIEDTRDLRIYIVTWNMNGSLPQNVNALFGDPSCPISRRPYGDCHLVVIGTQECEKSIEKSVLFGSQRKWDTLLDSYFSGFVRVKSDTLVAMHLVIFVRKEIKNQIHRIQNSLDAFSARLATGVVNVVGNKGAVGISLQCNNTSLLFVNAHLAGIGC